MQHRTPAPRARNKPISHTMPPALLQQVDEMAKRSGLSRAAFINAAVAQAVQHGLLLAAAAAQESHHG